MDQIFTASAKAPLISADVMLDGGVVETFLGAIAFGALDLTATDAATAFDAAAPALDAGGGAAPPLDDLDAALDAAVFGALDLTAAGAATALDAVAPALDAGGGAAAPLDDLDTAAFGALDLTAAGAATALDAAAPALVVACPCFFAMHLMQRRNFPGFPLH